MAIGEKIFIIRKKWKYRKAKIKNKGYKLYREKINKIEEKI